MRDFDKEPSALTEDLPPQSAELVLIRVFVSAYLATCHLRPRDRAPAMLREAARLLEHEGKIAALLPSRTAWQVENAQRARQQADALFRALLPTLIASLPGEE